MTKKINNKLLKLINYYSLINYNLIYDKHSINRYKKIKSELLGNKGIQLEKLEETIKDIKNCDLKKNSKHIVFADGNPNSKVMMSRLCCNTLKLKNPKAMLLLCCYTLKIFQTLKF